VTHVEQPSHAFFLELNPLVTIYDSRMMLNKKLETPREKVQETMLEHHAPGVSIGLIGAGVEHFNSQGVTDINHLFTVTPEPIF
jgi:hypothetical protein